jgi:hypothetical protein
LPFELRPWSVEDYCVSNSLWAAVPLSLLCAESCDDCRGVFAEEAVSHTCCVEAASLYYTVVLFAEGAAYCLLRVPLDVCCGCRVVY